MGVINESRNLLRDRDWRGKALTPRSAEPWAPTTVPRQFPTAWARTPAAGVVRAGIQHGVLKPLVWSLTAPSVEGLEYLERLPGPAVFVANHSSHLDTPLILGSLPRRFADRIAVGAASDYFFDTKWRAVLTALAINGFPVDRSGSGRTKLRHLAPRLLSNGWSLLLFPEGTRSADGWMNQIRVGSSYLCCATGVPAVPVAIRGSHAAMPRGRGWPVSGRPRITVRYGRPMLPDAETDVWAFNKRLSLSMARLWNEEDVGWYAAILADAAAATAVPAGPKPTGSWRRTWASSRALPSRDRSDVWR